MFPTFINILDIQTWWKVPSIAHFCSLFRSAFNLLDFDIEDLEEALLTDGSEEQSWLQELIVVLLKGCLPNNEISLFNYQMFLRRLFRRKCQQYALVNPFNTDTDFQLLPLRRKVDILHNLCEFRLDAGVDVLADLEPDSLRVVPLGYDANASAYWYFYGTRLYREDYQQQQHRDGDDVVNADRDCCVGVGDIDDDVATVWQVICFTLNDWCDLVKKFERSVAACERHLARTLKRNFLEELPRLFAEKETLARERVALRGCASSVDGVRHSSSTTLLNNIVYQHIDNISESLYEMAGVKSKDRKSKKGKDAADGKSKKVAVEAKSVGRQTNNSLSSATGQILIQPVSNPHRKKLKTSQVFSQTEEDLQVGLHKILDYVKNHDDAWPFIDPVEEEYAPNYYTIIRKPMDLQKMEERLDSGHYKTFSKFKTDFQLIVNNCRLYNGVDNEYTEMVDNLLQVFNRAVERYLDQITSSDEEIAVEYPDSKDKDKHHHHHHHHHRKSKHGGVASAATVVSPPRSLPAPVSTPTKNKNKRGAATPANKTPLAAPTPPSKRGKASATPDRDNSHERGAKAMPTKKTASAKSKAKVHANKQHTGKSNKRKAVDEFSDEDDALEDDDAPDKKVVHKSKKHKVGHSPTSKHRSTAAVVASKKQSKTIVETKETKKSSSLINKLANKIKDVKEKHSKKGQQQESNKLNKKQLKQHQQQQQKHHKSVKASAKNVSDHESERSLSNDRFSDSDASNYKAPLISKSSPVVGGNKKKMSTSSSSAVKKEANLDESSYNSKSKSAKLKSKHDKWKEVFKDDENDDSTKHKDKHNKLRETIEKLKAKSDFGKFKENDLAVYDFEAEKTKENEFENKSSKAGFNKKQNNHNKKTKKDVVTKQQQHVDEQQSQPPSNKNATAKNDGKTNKKKNNSKNNAKIDALSLVTEQTLKDINKWLVDTPKFPDFSSNSNSPSPFSPISEFESSNNKAEQDKKKSEKPVVNKKDAVKEVKRRHVQRDPTKMFPTTKKREIQRTIDRLQPGKSKGNLISTVQNAAAKQDADGFSGIGAGSNLQQNKFKDLTKNSLIVKTDETAPKLSLGTVLDNFGKHKFSDDTDDEEKDVKVKSVDSPLSAGKATTATDVTTEGADADDAKSADKKTASEPSAGESKNGASGGSGGDANADDVTKNSDNNLATPNLSAWFKAFGAPKIPNAQSQSAKKAEVKVEENSSSASKVAESSDTKKEDFSNSKQTQPPLQQQQQPQQQKVAPQPEPPSPNPDSPGVLHGQPVPRQRKVSTGSSVSERSSFSQDMDSPHVGIDERIGGTYAAPYPSPLYKSPSSGASPNVRSPLPDVISPKASASSYPFNGQIRVGFYQDTVSTKSSPEKSCSPRDNPGQSPYNTQYSEHVYAPQTTQPSAANYSAYNASSYYTNQQPTPPSYSTNTPSNPSSPYNALPPEQPTSLYYDTNKPLTDQYQAKATSTSVSTNQIDASQAPPQATSGNNSSATSATSSQQPQTNLDLYQQQQQQQQQHHDEYHHRQHAARQNIDVYNQQVQQPQQQQQPPPPAQQQHQPATQAVDNYRSHEAVTQNSIDSYRQLAAQQQQQQQQNSGRVDLQQQQQQIRESKSQQSSNATPTTFPVKKRAYSEIERFDDSYVNRSNIDMNLVQDRLVNDQINQREPKYIHQNIPEPRLHPQPIPQNQPAPNENLMRNYAQPPTNAYNAYNEHYSLTQQQQQQQQPQENPSRGVVMDGKSENAQKFTNMGYANEIRTSPNFPHKMPSEQPQYGDNVNMLAYKTQQHPPGEAPATRSYVDMELRGNLANLSHIVERYPSEMGNPPPGTYYSDKAPQHIFPKPPNTSNPMPSSLPYSHNLQSVPPASLYNRQEQADNAAPPIIPTQPPPPEKKSKRRKSNKTAVTSVTSSAIDTSLTTSAQPQGFQSYTGLKNAQIGEPGAISLKSASVVPGSAFNFGPTATSGLGLGSGLYPPNDKDAYSNFLDDYRSPSNYYMAAAAAAHHHRATPDGAGADKRSSVPNPQSPAYPFITPPPQPRAPPSYPPLGGPPFIPPPPHPQGALMDASSPLYQQYLQAGLLHQLGPVGPPGAYPPGYHPLSMRQPYDPMPRPSWL